MSRDPVTYGSEDQATLAGWLADATLGAVLTAETSGWRGFVEDLEEVDLSDVVPAETDGIALNPKASAAWRLGYGSDPSESRALGGDIVPTTRPIMYLTFVFQPHVARATVDALTEAFRSEIKRLAEAAGKRYNVSIPIVRGQDVGSWSAWPLMMRFRL